MTGLENGTIQKWCDGEIEKTYKCGGEKPLMKVLGDEIIVAAVDKLMILDTYLELKRQLKPTCGQSPRSLDVTSKYIAYGTKDGKVGFYDKNGSDEPTVSSKIKISFLFL